MFIKSNHPYEVEIQKVLIPKRKYSYDETNFGKRPFVEVTDEQLEKLKEDGVFQSLLKSKQYEILKSIPIALMNPMDKVKKIEEQRKDSIKELSALKKENKELKKKLEELEKSTKKVSKK